jgi:hypothetical protein
MPESMAGSGGLTVSLMKYGSLITVEEADDGKK